MNAAFSDGSSATCAAAWVELVESGAGQMNAAMSKACSSRASGPLRHLLGFGLDFSTPVLTRYARKSQTTNRRRVAAATAAPCFAEKREIRCAIGWRRTPTRFRDFALRQPVSRFRASLDILTDRTRG